MDGYCDVPGCTNKTYMGWGPRTERLGKQICEDHWFRHKNPADAFNLFDAFNLRRPAEIRMGEMLLATERAKGAKGIGKAIVRSPDVTALPTLADLGISKRESSEAQKKTDRRVRAVTDGNPPTYADLGLTKKEARVNETRASRCKACGADREPGHTFCDKCSRERKRQAHQQRQRRYRERRAQTVKA
ncbi:MAG TPA: hypothetical protein VMX13_13745 [Sedimentisphaerales bacterium]|nr:hypothetical protein [Sedimentisphaerales bacterium]